jgi:dTDP-4-amino-4,6-dideoxygalactose transaminase
MPNAAPRELEQRLAIRHGRRHCILAGRASSALYAIFRALPKKGDKIVFPAILCPQPANAALYAGFTPLFCDVSAETANLDPAALEDLLARETGIVAVVAAHLYGEPAEMERIAAATDKAGAVLIEDAAQAMGGTLGKRPLGSFGAVSVLSFGHTKLLDAGDGGAALTDDASLAQRIAEEAARLPPRPGDLAEQAAEYRALYYRLREMAGEDPRLNALFLPLPEMYRDIHLYRFDEARAEELLARLDTLDEEVARRRAKAALYAARLARPEVRQLKRSPGGVPWRFNLLLPPQQRQAITEALRTAGFDASHWYPALPKWYEQGRAQDPARFPNAAAIEAGVLNLWLDKATDEARIKACCAALNKLLDRAITTA